MKKRRKRLHLVLMNDDHNTFEWVIHTLMTFCNHNYYQAEQCAMLVDQVGEIKITSGFVPEILDTYMDLSKCGLSIDLRS